MAMDCHFQISIETHKYVRMKPNPTFTPKDSFKEIPFMPSESVDFSLIITGEPDSNDGVCGVVEIFD